VGARGVFLKEEEYFSATSEGRPLREVATKYIWKGKRLTPERNPAFHVRLRKEEKSSRYAPEKT
jgi:hypothetical protein